MNRTIRRTSLGFLVLFLALLININYIQAFPGDRLTESSGNHRVVLDEYSRKRGSILVDGEPVASSSRTEGALQYLRKYQQPELYGQITGYYSSIYGTNQLEKSENAILAGTDESLFVRRVIDMVTDKPPRGGDIELTLDPVAQQVAYEGLGDQVGAVAAIDPETGAVLALASTPTYDPNRLSTHDTKAQDEAWSDLTEDESNPMNNRATQFTYPPGSTFKLVTAATALEEGNYDAESSLQAPASLDLPLTTNQLNNWQRDYCLPGQSTVSLTEALETSCNTAFAQLGLDLGADKLNQQARAFGFGDSYLGALGTASSEFPADADRPQTALSAIGQFDVRATPLQIAMVTAAIANQGEVMEPYVVESRTDGDGRVIDETRPESLGRAMESGNADILRDMMVSVVENGTGEPAAIDGVEVGGKTGTAQTTEDQPPYAWFTSFASDGNQEVAVAVVIEETNVGRDEIAGGKLAAPIAKDVMETVLGR